jgi:adenylate cyclase
VLPFVNMSGDPEQEYFSDGITEEIITALSKTPKLFVIARNSTFTYKGKPVKVQQVGRELGVKYVLEGSVRKAEDQVRITAQLVDATTGHHLWAERYDRELQDIFAIQDEITLEIIKAMQVELTMGETARVTGKGTKNLDAYLSALQAQEEWFRLDKEGSIKARQLATQAIALDPRYGYPYAILAWSHMLDVVRHYSVSPEKSMSLAVEAIQKALALDPSDHRINRVLSNLHVMQGKHDEAIASSKRALELCPGGAGAYENLGIALLFACRPIEAIPMLEKAIQLDPFPPAVCHRNLAMAYCHVGRYEDAIEQGEKAFQINRNDLSTPFVLVFAYAKLGRKEQARAAAAEVLRIDPECTLDSMAETRARMFATKCHSDRVYEDIEFIRKADVGLK